MVCIICLADWSEVSLSIDSGTERIIFHTDFCNKHGEEAQTMIKKWIHKTRETVLANESDKKRWDKKPDCKEVTDEDNNEKETES